MSMNISKKKYGVFIVLCTLIVLVGTFMMESDDVYAEGEPYIWLNKTSNNGGNGDNIYNIGNKIISTPWGGTIDTYAVSCNNKNVKCCSYINGTTLNMVFATEFDNSITDMAIFIAETRGDQAWDIKYGYMTSYNDIFKYFVIGFNGSYSTSLVPNYDSLDSALTALNDNAWNGSYPVYEPEYNYSSDLGSLQNVYFRQVYDENNNSSQIEIIYDQYTSTGVNLNNAGYGISTQIARKDPVNNEVQISNTIAKLQEDSQKRRLFLLGLPLSGIRWSDISDTQHSTDYFFPDNSSTGSDNNNYNELVKYDILLRPYYFDGLDYTYGDTTVIENVDVNKIGTRMMKSFDETSNNDPVDLNYTVVKNTDYNFTWNDNSISYNEYNNYNVTNEDVVYNYTVNSDNSTEINNIGYSTTNIYNYDGDNPSFTFNDFNITQQDVINTVKSFKDVWSAIIYFVPHVLGLFAYLPTWSLVLVSGCFIILAGVCVVKFVAPLL